MQRYTEKILVSQHFPHLQDSQTIIFIFFLIFCPLKIKINAIQFILFQYSLYVLCKRRTSGLIGHHRFPFATGSTQTYFHFCTFYFCTNRFNQTFPSGHPFSLKYTWILKWQWSVFIRMNIQENKVVTCPQAFCRDTTTVVKITPHIRTDHIVLLCKQW